MADYNNIIFKPRKNSGFVIKFRLSSDKAYEKQRDREQAYCYSMKSIYFKHNYYDPNSI